DLVIESGDLDNADVIAFDDWLEVRDLVFKRNGDDLVVRLSYSQDRLTIKSFFSDPEAVVETFRFGDYPYDYHDMSAAEVRAQLLLGGDGEDVILGYASDDLLSGSGGRDTLQGLAGQDTLSGGQGADLLQGGEDGDTYAYARGDGRDTIVDGGSAG